MESPNLFSQIIYSSGIRSPGSSSAIATALFLSLLPVCVAASEPSIRIGLYENEPKVYRGDDGAPRGLFVDIIGSIAGHEDWQLEFVFCQWAACLEKLESGQLDLMPDVAPSALRHKRFNFNDVPVAQAWSQVYVGPGTVALHLEALDGKRISVLRDSAQFHYLEDL